MSHLTPPVVALLAFALVFAALSSLALLLFALRALAARAARVAAARQTPAGDAVDPVTLAVLAAAVHTALGAPVRIHHVHVHGERSGQGWERAGRMDIMFSHRVMPK